MTESTRPRLGVPRDSSGVTTPQQAQPEAAPAQKHTGCGCGGKCAGGGKRKRAADRAPIGLEAEGRANLGLRAAK
ncbi:hypothetical protein ABYF34_08690 [Buchananella felis]|uniref:hypothetical protein n=1 Tax=Buchananella felis TaxID=3231492 RepID=UPI0035273EA5